MNQAVQARVGSTSRYSSAAYTEVLTPRLDYTPLTADPRLRATSGGSSWSVLSVHPQPNSGRDRATTSAFTLFGFGFLCATGMTGIYFTGAMQLNYAFPTGSIEPIEYPLIQAAHNEEPVAANRLTAPTAADLIKEIRESSGLTLEMIAPLLGVSRRSIQSWKAGEPISVRKEERLRELAGAIKKMSQGKPKETQNLLLERIPGTPRIYDLLAERRFETAITRAKAREKFKPIYSDQSLIFSHVLLDAQIAAADDGPSEQTGQIDRKVSRRLKR